MENESSGWGGGERTGWSGWQMHVCMLNVDVIVSKC